MVLLGPISEFVGRNLELWMKEPLGAESPRGGSPAQKVPSSGFNSVATATPSNTHKHILTYRPLGRLIGSFLYILILGWLDFGVRDHFQWIRIEISCKSDLLRPPDLKSEPNILNKNNVIWRSYHKQDMFGKLEFSTAVLSGWTHPKDPWQNSAHVGVLSSPQSFL